MEKPIYNFKKGDVEYEEKRKQYLIDLTKYKYHTNKEFKEKMKNTSKNRYNKLVEAYKSI
jgi:hypothetical protein